MRQDYRQQGYYDVVYAKDQYHWDMPELRGCLSVYNEEDYDISEMIMVVTYNTMRYVLDTHLMVLKDIKDDTEAKKEMEEAEEEITPLTFSNPQKDLVYSYFADATLREMWSTNKIDYSSSKLCYVIASHIHTIMSPLVMCIVTHKESSQQKESQMATLVYLMKMLSVGTSQLVNLLMKVTILLHLCTATISQLKSLTSYLWRVVWWLINL